MEVQFEPAPQAKLEQIARKSGRAAAELVQDAVAGYKSPLGNYGRASVVAHAVS